MKRFPFQKFAILCLCSDREWHWGREFLELSITDRPKRTARELSARGHLFVDYRGSRNETVYRITDKGMRYFEKLNAQAVERGISMPGEIIQKARRLHRKPVEKATQAAQENKNQTLFSEWEKLHG